MINATGDGVRSCDSPTMMCSAEVTGSLVPTVAKQIQSVEPERKEQSRQQARGAGFTAAVGISRAAPAK